MASTLNRDPLSLWFGEPEFYEILTPGRGALRLHPSRVIRFLGNELPDPSLGVSVWSDSVLQTLYDAIHAVALTTTGATSLMHEAKVDVVTVPNLSEHLSSAATTAQLSARFAYAAAMKSMNNLLLLGDGETWSRQRIDFSGLPEMVRTFLQVAAGAADIPVTRLLGQSPAGMSATGESDTRNYYDMIAARQEMDLRPKLERLDGLLLRSAGLDPSALTFEFRPLWQMDAAASAAIALQKAQVTQIYAAQRISYGTRTDEGSRPYAAILSIVETCRRRKAYPWGVMERAIVNARTGLKSTTILARKRERERLLPGPSWPRGLHLRLKVHVMVDTYQQPGAAQPANIVDKVSETFSIVDYIPPAQLAAAKLGQVDIASYALTMFNAISSANRGAAHFPAGKWMFASNATFTQGSNVDVITVFGDGPDVTELTWPTANGGITINTGGNAVGYHFRDMTFSSGVANGGNAISINSQSGSVDLTTFDNLVFRGADGYQAAFGWSAAILLGGVSNVNFRGVYVSGFNGFTGAGIIFQGFDNHRTVIVLNVTDCIFNFCSNGLVYGPNVQGVKVSGTNCINGIISTGGSTGQDQLIVTGCQFGMLPNTNGNAIALTSNVRDVDISHNLFLFHNGAVYIASGDFLHVQSNFFSGFDPNGIGLTILNPNATIGSIEGNTFFNHGTGVQLAQGTAGHTVGMSNVFENVATPVNNLAGAANHVFTAPKASGKIWGDGDAQFINTATGWAIKYPNGYTRQGGRIAGGQGDINITYPLPFTTIFSVEAKIIGRNPVQIYDVGIDNIGVAAFSAGPRYCSGGTVGVATQPYQWWADGYITP